MTPIIFLAVVLIVTGLCVVLFAARDAHTFGTTTKAEFLGMCSAGIDRTALKEQNKDKVLAYLRDQREAPNSVLRERVSVASRTLVRYMDELEKEGKVAQVGVTGKSVIYRAT